MPYGTLLVSYKMTPSQTDAELLIRTHNSVLGCKPVQGHASVRSQENAFSHIHVSVIANRTILYFSGHLPYQVSIQSWGQDTLIE